MNSLSPPSPIIEVDTPEHTPNPPGNDDSFTTAKDESFELSSLELGKISEQMEIILAQLDKSDKQTVILAYHIPVSVVINSRKGQSFGLSGNSV